jgi:hypothetical protein
LASAFAIAASIGVGAFLVSVVVAMILKSLLFFF